MIRLGDGFWPYASLVRFNTRYSTGRWIMVLHRGWVDLHKTYGHKLAGNCTMEVHK